MEDRLTQLKKIRQDIQAVQSKIEDPKLGREFKDNLSERKRLAKKAYDLFSKSLEKDITGWIKEGFTPETVYFTEFFGFHVADEDLTTSQIRNVFNEVKKIQMSGATHLAKMGLNDNEGSSFSQTDLLMLAPRLSYAAVRSKKHGGKLLKQVLTIGLNAVVETDDHKEKIRRFDNFSNFFEAILCYHKTAGGKDSDKN